MTVENSNRAQLAVVLTLVVAVFLIILGLTTDEAPVFAAGFGFLFTGIGLISIGHELFYNRRDQGKP